MNDEKNYIIDPFTMLCKLALIYFMPNYTKISISNHVLHLQEYTYYQWAERMMNGDNRKDVSYLYSPIVKMIKWYVYDNPEKIQMDNALKEDINIIVSYCIKGLRKTQNVTYDKDLMIKILLQYFINLITDASIGTLSENNMLKLGDTQYEPNILEDRIKNNYDPKMINSIAKMMIDADNIDTPDLLSSDTNLGSKINPLGRNFQGALVDCVHKLLLNRDEIFIKTMKDVNTVL
uniref:Uncharacterized protein n=1 Tax=viral metagenome TaxID=1070528 RepID=A0A6C0CBP8_9ZZZZ